jgi:hypothetical protein
VIARRHFALLAGGVVVVLTLLVGLAWWVLDSPDEPSLAEPLTVNATLGPPQHMFADPIRARIEVVLDSKRVDPDSVKIQANFTPYRPLQPPTQSESSAGRVTRLRFDYRLACLAYRCVPLSGAKRFELRNAAVAYNLRSGGGPRTEDVDWPMLTVSGRINPRRFWEAQTRAEFRELGPPTYRVSPRLVTWIALPLALIFGAAAVVLILRLLPLGRIAERLGLRTVDTRTPLERALARVRETSTPDKAEEGRRALERLAHELRRARNPELAGAASELAWSREFPADGRLTRLSGEVERLISEER